MIRSLQTVDTFSAGNTISAPRSGGRRPFAIADGWAASYHVLSDGRRQIVSLLLPGDHAGLSPPSSNTVDLPIVSLTRVRLVSAHALKAAIAGPDAREHAGLLQAVQEAEAMSARRLIDHVVRLGRQSALERTAHLAAELFGRLRTVDMVEGYAFQLPLTQECLADTLGLSIVHVNRTLKQLKRERIVEIGRGRVRILDYNALAMLADYA